MHKEVKQFIRKVRRNHPRFFFNSDVLEFGSAIINGSPRSFFWLADYTGIDLFGGKGVDVIGNGDTFYRCYYADVTVSTECLEHCATWEGLLLNMFRHTTPKGLMIVTCAGPKRERHGVADNHPEDSPATNDYYRNVSIIEFQEVLFPSMFSSYFIRYARDEKDLLFYGIKK